jgi:hypothetical protein
VSTARNCHQFVKRNGCSLKNFGFFLHRLFVTADAIRMDTTPSTYPGELATPDQVRRLADEYRNAAHHLLTLGRKREPLSRAPFRFAAIHAIELYLSAFLLHRGQGAATVRSFQHNLTTRTNLALQNCLVLRQRTVNHLHSMTNSREYLVMRYGPETTVTASQINRLSATLDEVAKKVTAAILATS